MTEDGADLLEVEAKYEVPADFVLPIPASLGTLGDIEDEHLDARYFDTADFELAAFGVTLRRREGGSDEGWHLKLPGDEPEVRQEIHHALDGSTSVPEALSRIVFGLTLGAPLRPVVELVTHRRVAALSTDGVRLGELALDDVEARLLSSGDVSNWHELEIELLDRSEKDLFKSFDDLLRRHGARRADYPSKMHRALGAVAGLDDKLPGEPLRRRLTAQRHALVVEDSYVRAGVAPDGVHDLRVAVRRLRSLLRTFRPAFDKEPRRHLEAELRWLASELGVARDAETMAEHFQKRLKRLAELGHESDESARQALVGHLESDVRATRAELAEALSSDRYTALLGTLRRFVDHPPYRRGQVPDGTLLRRCVGRELRRMRRRVNEASAAPRATRAPRLHEARKVAKRIRYAGETLSTGSGAPERLARAYENVQEILGDHHDAIVATEIVRKQAELAKERGEDRYLYGILVGFEEGAAKESETAFEKAWKKARSNRVVGFVRN